MSGIEDFARLIQGDHGLVVVSTLRPDLTIQSSVVNAGVLPHPVTGAEVVLYTDLANPTSNALYERLGYRPVEDRTELSFAPAAGSQAPGGR